jgi:hypothetical protein
MGLSGLSRAGFASMYCRLWATISSSSEATSDQAMRCMMTRVPGWLSMAARRADDSRFSISRHRWWE